MGQTIALYDGNNVDLLTVLGVNNSSGVVSVSPGFTYGYNAGTGVLVLRYRGTINARTRTADLDTHTDIETVGYGNRFQNIVLNTAGVNQRECGWVIYNTLLQFASGGNNYLTDLVINPANFVMTTNASGSATPSSPGTGIAYTTNSPQEKLSDFLADVITTANANDTNIPYALYVDLNNAVHFTTYPTGTAGPTVTYNLNGSPPINSDGVVDIMGAQTTRDQDMTNLVNTYLMVGGTDPNTQQPVQCIVENQDSVNLYGIYQSVYTQQYITDVETLTNFGVALLNQTAFPQESTNTTLTTTGTFCTPLDYIRVTGWRWQNYVIDSDIDYASNYALSAGVFCAPNADLVNGANAFGVVGTGSPSGSTYVESEAFPLQPGLQYIASGNVGGKLASGSLAIQVVGIDNLSRATATSSASALTRIATAPFTVATSGQYFFRFTTNNATITSAATALFSQPQVQLYSSSLASPPTYSVNEDLYVNVQTVETTWSQGSDVAQTITGAQLIPSEKLIMEQIAAEAYLANPGYINGATNVTDRFVIDGCFGSYSQDTFTMTAGDIGAKVFIAGNLQLNVFPVSSFSFMPASAGAYTVSFAYRNNDGTALVDPYVLDYLGPSAAAAGLTDYQVIPLWRVNRLGSVIVSIQDLRNIGSVGTGNFNPNTPTPAWTGVPTASSFGSIPGVLQDVTVQLTVNNVPDDGSVSKVAWFVRNSAVSTASAYGNSPASPPALVQTIHSANVYSGGSGGYVVGFTAPTAIPISVGNLVVAAVGANYAGAVQALNGWNIAISQGSTSYGGLFWKVWTTSDASSATQAVANMETDYAGAGITLWEFRNFNTTAPLTQTQFAYMASPSTTFATSTTPQTTNGVVVGLAGYSGSIPTPVGGSLSLTSGFSADQAAEDSDFGSDFAFSGWSFHSVPTTHNVAMAATGTFTGYGTHDYAGLVVTALVNPAFASQINTGQGPWTLYNESPLPQLYPYPQNVQALENGYGQLSLGVSYDFGLAYVNTAGVAISSPIAFITGYIPNNLQIPTPYMLGNKDFTPTIANATCEPVVVTDGNTTSTSFQVSFEYIDQPTDGSLSRISYYIRNNGVTAWTYYGSEEAYGVGTINPSASANYSYIYCDCSNGQLYDFGMAAEDAQGGDSEVAYIITSNATEIGVPTGSNNLVVDSQWLASTYFTPGSGPFKTNKVAVKNPYWQFYHIDPTAQSWVICSNPPASAGHTQDEGYNSLIGSNDGSGVLFEAVSSPIAVIAGSDYTASGYLNFKQSSGAPGFLAIVDTVPSGGHAYSTIYAAATGTAGMATTPNVTWTCPASGVSEVAFLFSSNSMTTTQYTHMNQPMLQIGDAATGYIAGPTVSDDGASRSYSVVLYPSDISTNTVTVFTASGAPSASASSPSLYIRNDATGAYLSSGSSWVQLATGASSGSASITSINSATGPSIVIQGSGGTTVSTAGNTLTVYSATGSSGGVTSLNSLTGPLAISAGTNINVSTAGSSIIINSTASGSGSAAAGVTSLNAATGALAIQAGANITVTPSGSAIIIASTASGSGSGATTGVTSLNAATGALAIHGGTNVTVTTAGSAIFINATAGGGASGSALGGDTDVNFTNASVGNLLGVISPTELGLVQRVSGSTTTATATITMNTACLAGSLIVAYGEYYSTATAPSGWTVVATKSNPSQPGYTSTVWQYTAVGGETSFAWTSISYGSGYPAFFVEEWQGASPIGSTSGTDYITGAYTTSPGPYTLTGVAAGSVCVAFQGSRSAGSNSAQPGWTAYYYQETHGDEYEASLDLYEYTNPTAGSVSYTYSAFGYNNTEANVLIQIKSAATSQPYGFYSLLGSGATTIAASGSHITVNTPTPITAISGPLGSVVTGEVYFTGNVTQTGNTFNFSASGSGGGTTATLHTAQQQISSLIHQWRCNDAAGSTTLADSKGSTALTVGSDCTVGVPGLLNDGATCVYLPGQNDSNSYLSASSVFPTTGAMSCEMVFHCLTVGGNSSNLGLILCIDNVSSSGFNFQWRTASGYGQYEWARYGVDTTFYYGDFTAKTVVLHLEADGSGGYYGYLNGQLIYTGSGAPTTLTTPTITVGKYAGGSPVYTPTMFVQNIAIYNARLTAAQKAANMNAVFRR